jgi:UDP-sulfoquinovose synthase
LIVRVLVLGGDGYLGWPTALHFAAAGHEVAVVDNYLRRRYDDQLGTASLVPISPLSIRIGCWREVGGTVIDCFIGDITDPEFLTNTLQWFKPQTIIHLAEQRSAPYSMVDRAHAVHTQVNNVVGTLNLLWAIAEVDSTIHLIKLGTMGEYGTPDIDIEEGWLHVTHRGRSDTLPFPKQPGSFYHLSKVHDSHNIMFCCRAWGLRATDLNQGVVYGCDTPQTQQDPALATRFDYDATFGTVLNRFVVQAVAGHALTVYGSGGQTRGFLHLLDTMSCLELAAEHPAEPGEFRVFNHFTETFSVLDLAERVAQRSGVAVDHLPNPRVELEHHHYRAINTGLLDLGLRPHPLTDTVIDELLAAADRHRGLIDADTILPETQWRPRRLASPSGSPSCAAELHLVAGHG